MMDNGKIILDIEGSQRENTTVSDLIEQFKEKSGNEFDNDRILLTK